MKKGWGKKVNNIIEKLKQVFFLQIFCLETLDGSENSFISFKINIYKSAGFENDEMLDIKTRKHRKFWLKQLFKGYRCEQDM